MAGSSFGNIFKITTWGESHGKAIGVVVDGCPAGLPLTESDIQYYLDMRKPGQTKYSTPRKEADAVEILSGIFEGKTTGTPISMIVWNKNARSTDYSEIANYYRPGHADYTFDMKYGFRDYRGGGRSSARETIGRVAAGAIALKLLNNLGIKVNAYTRSIGPICIDYENFELDEIYNNPMCMPDKHAAKMAEDFVMEKITQKDSVGGVIECRVNGMPAGIGDPVFEKLSANLAKAVCSVGAVKGFEIGDGFKSSESIGSINNDEFILSGDSIVKATNHSGGLLGGMSDGSDIIFRAAIKPTPSIASPQNTVTKNGEPINIQIKGRHDPIIMPRAAIVIKSMTALVLIDALMQNMSARMDYINDFYNAKKDS